MTDAINALPAASGKINHKSGPDGVLLCNMDENSSNICLVIKTTFPLFDVSVRPAAPATELALRQIPEADFLLQTKQSNPVCG